MPDRDRTFTSSMASFYDTVLGPMLFAPFAPRVAEVVAAPAPTTVLETAAGTGRLTYELVRRLPDSRIVATDLNPGMLDYGAELGGAPHLTWRQVDAQSLPFADDTFEAVACQFGAMFFPDRVAAYAEARRVLVDDGQLTLAIWGALSENSFARVVDEAVRPFVGGGPSFMERLPHGYHDTDRIRSDLRAGGFASVDIERISMTVRVASAVEVATGYAEGTPTLADVPPPHDAIIEVTAQALRRELASGNGDEVEGVNTAFVVTAR